MTTILRSFLTNKRDCIMLIKKTILVSEATNLQSDRRFDAESTQRRCKKRFEQWRCVESHGCLATGDAGARRKRRLPRRTKLFALDRHRATK